MMMTRKAKAFTLIEVLVVVAIIALLIAILLPSLASAREQAKRVACGSALKTLGEITHMYATEDKQGYFPDLHDAKTIFGDGKEDNTLPYPHWYSYRALNIYIQKYKLDKESFFCPSNPDWWLENNHWEIEKYRARVLGYVYFGNFKWGNDIPYLLRYNFSWYPAPEPEDRRPITAFKITDKPQRNILWADLTRSKREDNGIIKGSLNNKSGGNHVNGYVKVGSDGQLKLPPNGGGNVGLIDGSVEWRNTPAMKHQIKRNTYDFFW